MSVVPPDDDDVDLDDWMTEEQKAAINAALAGEGPAKARKDNGGGEPTAKLAPIRFVEGESIPPRDWIVPDGWLGTRTSSLFQGDGGDGKSTIAQQLHASCATALPWLGLRVEECASVGFYTEDEERDLKLRQPVPPIGG